MAPRTPMVMVIKGFTFHPLCFSVSINGSYNLCLFSIIVSTQHYSTEFVRWVGLGINQILFRTIPYLFLKYNIALANRAEKLE
jgi:hypothetical protein